MSLHTTLGDHATTLVFATKTCGVTPPCWALLELLEVGVSVLEVKIAFVDVDIGLFTGEVELDLKKRVTVCLCNGRPAWLLATVLLRAGHTNILARRHAFCVS